jgi:hypothetical protein
MRLIVCGLVFLAIVLPCLGETFIVDPNGSADFTQIQAAIDYSWDGDTIVVRPGTYNQYIKFNGRRITLTSLDPNNPSVVSSTIITYNFGTLYEGPKGAVTFDFGENANSVITGFTITGQGYCGQGIYCYASAPMILKNIIQSCGNAGVYGVNASPTISNNKIINNGVYSSYNNIAGGIYGCDGLIYNNIISGNTNKGDGGGLYGCMGTIANNLISGNHSLNGGGLAGCNGIIINNAIVGNGYWCGNPTGCGGGIYGCSGIIKNNIIAFNKATSGGGVHTATGNSYNTFWMNDNGNFGGNATPGVGDIVRNPFFAFDGHWSGQVWIDGDYHLKSTAGRWTVSGWVLDGVDSPCIDKGDPSDSIGVEPNPNGGRINIGAYGGTLQASKSPSGIVQPVCTEYPQMDFNKDCKVDLYDFAVFSQGWLLCNLDPQSACWQ